MSGPTPPLAAEAIATPFTPLQLETLEALEDVFIQPLSAAEKERLVNSFRPLEPRATYKHDVEAYADCSWSKLGLTPVAAARLPKMAASDKLDELRDALNLLANKAACLVLTGHYSAFKDLTLEQRTKAVQSWLTSRLATLRLLARTFQNIAMFISYSHLDNPHLEKILGYPGIDPECNTARFAEKTFPEYEFISVPKEGLELTCDVVVIGSGAGGGPVAAELAKAGKSVIVLEKGRYFHQKDLTVDGVQGFEMFEQGGYFASKDGTMNVGAGSTFGGGTTVNWSGSLKPQHYVREQWAAQGLKHFLTAKYAQQLDRVFERMGVSDQYIKHNEPNSVLLQGCAKLGYPCAAIPQNTNHAQHSCGWCGFGCKYGEKQGCIMTWLQDARDHGARFVQEAFVDKVLINQKAKTATGVKASVGKDRHPLTIHAEKVVVSAGTLNSPGVLMRSGLTNRNIGKHLWLHPVTLVFGIFPDRNIDRYKGSIMTAVSNVAENVDGDHWGAKIEVPMLHPNMLAAILPWNTPLEHKQNMAIQRHIVPLIILVRDKDSVGSVAYTKQNTVEVSYALSAHDKKSMLEGMVKGLYILKAAGAAEVRSVQKDVPSFKIQTGSPESEQELNDRFEAWITKSVRKAGVNPSTMPLVCAHQMGTCRMGVSPRTSVVQPTGETWEVKNLYVADASTFPTSTGVNPMVTTESMGLVVADNIIRSTWKGDKGIQARL